MSEELHAVTGAFGYSGRFIAARLLAAGHAVRTLTNAPATADPFEGQVEVHPLRFDDSEALTDSLRGVQVLYNTYWIRFDHRRFRQSSAIDNTLRLFEAARRAGVSRVVHTSITNPSEDSPYQYFRGKARLERALISSGLSHAILRPAVSEDVKALQGLGVGFIDPLHVALVVRALVRRLQIGVIELAQPPVMPRQAMQRRRRTHAKQVPSQLACHR